MKITTVHIEEIISSDRFEPEYWTISNMLETMFQQNSWVSLDDCSRFIRKGIFDLKAEKYKDKGVPFLRISNLKYFDLDKSGMVYISDTDNFANKRTILNHKDIAFSKIGTLGKLLRIDTEFPCVNLSQNLIGVGLNDILDKNYVFAFLLSKCALYQINKNRKKQLQDKLNLNDVKELRIVDIDSKTKEIISQNVDVIEQKGIEANSLIAQAQQLFYDALGIDFSAIEKQNTFSVSKSDFARADLWTPMYSYPLYVNTIKAIQTKWQTIPLGEIADLVKGDEVGSDNYIGYLDKRKTDVPFVRTSDIVNYETDQYPDFYIPEEIYKELAQDVHAGDILFSKDGKIGMVGMITKADKAIIASGFCILHLREEGSKVGLTPEYLFTALSIKEIGIYASKRRTVVASTIPHLREERVKEIEIPILDSTTIQQITDLVHRAFSLKAERKRFIAEVRETMDNYFSL